MTAPRPPIITFVGKSGTGKTTYLERLIPVLKARGLTLAVIKHDVRSFQMDTPGKDTFRFTEAGADVVAIASADRAAVLCRTEEALSLDQLAAGLPPVDLILTEGYRSPGNPKIELHRAGLNRPLLTDPAELLAVVTDEPLPVKVPQLDLDDPGSCAELILSYVKQYNNAAGRTPHGPQ